jgi:hypothetical protein
MSPNDLVAVVRGAELPEPDMAIVGGVIRRRARRRRFLTAAASTLVVALVAAGAVLGLGTGQHGEAGTTTVAPPAVAGPNDGTLPSDGWAPGKPALTAITAGPFHARAVSQGACAWLGDSERPFVWPAGYRVLFNPTRLVDATGALVATDGEVLAAPGGGEVAPQDTLCGAKGSWTFFITGVPAPVRHTAATTQPPP